ncbi:MAG: hypothetical protein NT169_04245 [Chloroflexi bacterium]|nr:hypothetical protein [Chloroflexota bacterium]
MTSSDTILHDLATLSPADQERVHEYIAFLRWRAEPDPSGFRKPEGSTRPWQVNLLEHFASADVRASKDRAGMEVKAAEATVGGERRPALWMHPPVAGEAAVEFHVPVPAGLTDVRLRFAIGIRDGAQADDRLVAFRVRVGGWQVWSRAAWPIRWEPVEVALPLQAGDVLRLTFATDGLAAHQFAWAVWGEPVLEAGN